MGSEGPVAKNQIANPEMIIPAPENVYEAEIEMVTKCTLADVGRYALDIDSTKDALEKFLKQSPKFPFKRTSRNSWKILVKKSGDYQTFNEKGQPNPLSETLLKKKNDVIVDSFLAGTVRRMIITILRRLKIVILFYFS